MSNKKADYEAARFLGASRTVWLEKRSGYSCRRKPTEENVMAMANKRDGGIIIIGIAEKDHLLTMEGLSPEQASKK